MKSLAFLIFAFVFTLTTTFSSIAGADCSPSNNDSAPLSRIIQIFQNQEELKDAYNQTYLSPSRFADRAFLEADHILIPYGKSKTQVPRSFIQRTIEHIDRALKNHYVDYVFYPDLGHMHLYLPSQEWSEIKKNENASQRLIALLSSKNLKSLYHTFELFQVKEGDFANGKLPQDPWKLWRYFSRNLLGSYGDQDRLEVIFAGANAQYNTVRSLEGMTEVTTLYVSSNKNGCFPYSKGYLDFSFGF